MGFKFWEFPLRKGCDRVALETKGACMRFLHQIAITSETGVGSSSLLKALQKMLEDQPYRWVSGGSLMRQKAAELDMSIERFAEYNRLHPEEGHDHWCDSTIQKMAEEDWLICESRLAHFFLPHALKVLLTCPLGVRAFRRARDLHKPLHEVVRAIVDRDRNDRERYAVLYPGCLWKHSQFDLVLDTDLHGTPDQIAERLLRIHSTLVDVSTSRIAVAAP